MSNTRLKLFGYLACPYVQRVRAALDYKQIKYEYEEVDILRHAQKTPQYLAINPFGKVPSLQIESGENLFESLPVLEYIENQYNGGIFPASHSRKAFQRIWVNFFDQTVMSKFWTILPHYKAKDKQNMDVVTAQVLQNLAVFSRDSGLSKKTAAPGSLIEGNTTPTYADFAIIPCLRAMDIFYRRLNNDDQFGRIASSASQNPDLQALLKYFESGKQHEFFTNITTKLSTFPAKTSNPILHELNPDLPQKFDYETFALRYQSQKYS